MLILTRRVGEIIRINDDISVQVLGVSGQQVRIGIIAPDDITVHREEILSANSIRARDRKRCIKVNEEPRKDVSQVKMMKCYQ